MAEHKPSSPNVYPILHLPYLLHICLKGCCERLADSCPQSQLFHCTSNQVKHKSPLLNPCWLFLSIFLSVLCLKMVSERFCSIIFLETELRLTGQSFFPESSCSSWWWYCITFLKSWGVSSNHCDLSVMLSDCSFLPLSLYIHAMSLYSSWVACPCLHPLCS